MPAPIGTVEDANMIAGLAMTGGLTASTLRRGGLDPASAGVFYRPRDPAALQTAQTLERKGATGAEIWEATGLERAADGAWRAELDTTEAQIAPPATATKTTLGKVMSWPALYQAYPQLRDMPIEFADANPAYRGMYHPSDKRITVWANGRDPADQRDTILHEVQHAIQDIERFAGGTNDRWEAKRIDQEWRAAMRARLTQQIGEATADKVDDLMAGSGNWQRFRARQTPEENEIADAAYNEYLDLRRILDAVADENYRREKGEVEARNVPERDRQRRVAAALGSRDRLPPPVTTEDVPRSQQRNRRDPVDLEPVFARMEAGRRPAQARVIYQGKPLTRDDRSLVHRRVATDIESAGSPEKALEIIRADLAKARRERDRANAKMLEEDERFLAEGIARGDFRVEPVAPPLLSTASWREMRATMSAGKPSPSAAPVRPGSWRRMRTGGSF